MKCKHKNRTGLPSTGGRNIHWCLDCGALKHHQEEEWWIPKSANKIEQLKKEIKRLKSINEAFLNDLD